MAPDEKQIDAVLKRYGLTYKAHEATEHGLGNTTLHIQTSEDPYILKIHDDQDTETTRYVATVESSVAKGPGLAPKPQETTTGELITHVDDKPAVLYEHLSGHHPTGEDPDLVKSLGEQVSRLHRHTSKLNFPQRPKPELSVDLPHMYDDVNHSAMQAEPSWLQTKFKELDQDNLPTTVIHGDILNPNILVEDNKVSSFIDYGDTRIDHAVYELAPIYAHVLISQDTVHEESIAAFHEGYEDIVDQNERRALYYFTLARLLGVIGFHEDQEKRHQTSFTDAKETAAKEYLRLKDYGEEYFTGLIDHLQL